MRSKQLISGRSIEAETSKADIGLLLQYAEPRPRYTSYPTAPHFHSGIGAVHYRRWLATLKPRTALSLYIHVPFCDSLCWFCACTTKIVNRYEPIARYLRHLETEMALVSALVPPNHIVTHIHWGGGSPDILSPDDITNLAAKTNGLFQTDDTTEFAAEVDPRAVTPNKAAAWARAGLTRVSFGVQDFDPRVQAAINRRQSFEATRAAVELFRQHGNLSVNIDLVYGLPHQTVVGSLQTVDRVASLDPDRVALFGYAHLPTKIRHQRMIDDATVPDITERFAQSQAMAQGLLDAGYVRVGLDHFAKPDDALARQQIHRNFQGYTTDSANALIGFGASSIGRLPQGYIQNAIPVAEYERRVARGELATVRGFRLSQEDRIRAFAIERLMCELRFPARELSERFGPAARNVLSEARDLLRSDADGLLEPDDIGFRVTETGRPYLRSICAHFDVFLNVSNTLHSVGI